jgi:hypothetical protein
MVKQYTSPAGSFTWEDAKKVLKGAGIAAGGAVLVYLGDFLKVLEIGEYTPIAVAVGSILINFGRKWVNNNK